MKKFLSMAALAVAALSCTEDLETPQVETPATGETKTITVEASLSNDDQTRVAIDGDGSGYEWDFKWEADDQITCYNIEITNEEYGWEGNVSYPLTIVTDAFDEKKATFTGTIPASGTSYLYYNLEEDYNQSVYCDVTRQNGTISQIPLRSVEKIDYEQIVDGAVTPISMQHLGAFVKINVTGDITGYSIHKIIVLGLNSCTSRGDMAGGMPDGDAAEEYEKSNIAITPESPIVIGSEQITIPFTIFPTEVTEAEPITVLFCLTDGSGAEKYIKIVKAPSAGNTWNLERATVNTLGAELSSSDLFAFEGKGTESEPYLIQDAEDLRWLSFLSNNVGQKVDAYYRQTANIDLENKLFTPIEFILVTTYDGDYHTISNLNVNTYNDAGLFGYISQTTIKNLAVQGSVTNTDSRDEAGGIVSYAYDSDISDCYNNGKVNGSDNYTGAIVGYVYYESSSKDNKYLSGSASKANGYVDSDSSQSNNTAVNTPISIEEFFGIKDPSAKFSGGSGIESDPYRISEGADLRELSDDVNNNKLYYAGEYFIMTDDINLGGEANEFAAIGRSGGVSFQGSFDGQGNTVSGLYINQPEASYQGLFGYIKNATIENLTVDGDITGISYVSGVAGYCLTSTIDNCTNNATVTIAKSDTSYAYIGGVTGYSNSNSTISNCTNNETVSIIDHIATYGEIGGVVGYSTSNSPIYNCTNNGTVTVQNGGLCVDIGGVAGSVRGSSVVNCYNTADVTIVNALNSDNGDTYYNIGGVVGVCNSENISVTNCYNSAKVEITNVPATTLRYYNTGGVLGCLDSKTEIINCYNSGEVVCGYNTKSSTGGVVGRSAIWGKTIKNCYWNSDNNASLEGCGSSARNGDVGVVIINLVGKTSDEMKGDAFASLLYEGAKEYNRSIVDGILACKWSQEVDGYPSLIFNFYPAD